MRKITSIILAISFLVLAASGLQLALGPKPQKAVQQVASGTGGNGSAAKGEIPVYPKKAHEWAGYIFIGAGAVHIALNKKAMLSYVSKG